MLYAGSVYRALYGSVTATISSVPSVCLTRARERPHRHIHIGQEQAGPWTIGDQLVTRKKDKDERKDEGSRVWCVVRSGLCIECCVCSA
jgi:hypothetical protein